MIFIGKTNKECQLVAIKLMFLKIIPLNEIDHPNIQIACKSFRNKNTTLAGALGYLALYDNYFYIWDTENKTYNTFLR
jgi:hypothetical protein